MIPPLIIPGKTRIRVRFWARITSPPNEPEQYDLFLGPAAPEMTATIMSHNQHGCRVFCDIGPNNAIHNWQAIVPWQDVLEELPNGTD